MYFRRFGRFIVLPLSLCLVIAGNGKEKDAALKTVSSTLKTHPSHALFEKVVHVPQGITVNQFSSHNKKGFNSDETWPLYIDENNDEVIFDATGPGCIRSMWATYLDSSATVKFYFDGEKKPSYSMKYVNFYNGDGNSKFSNPLISFERRGTCCINEPNAGNSFIPIPYSKSLKISIQGLSRFYHILYEKYPYGTPIKTFTGREDRATLEDCFNRIGEAPLDTNGLTVFNTRVDEIEPLQTIPLLDIKDRSGIIRIIEMGADGSEEFFQKARIRMRWDGHTRWDVLAPIGIFFGSAVEAEDMRSLPLRVEKLENGRVRLYCYFPMPFWEKAEISLVNLSEEYKGPLDVTIYVSDNTVEQPDGTYFTTLYHEGETVYGHDWLLYEATGSGWLVGVVQSMQYGHYCEGDERFYIDGAISPQINGTGTEDYYLACFWSNIDFDLPFGCVVGDVLKKGGGHWRGTYYTPACYSRYHLEAPIPFYSSINARIQHGGLSNIRSNYRSLAFAYLNKQAKIRQTDYIDIGNSISEKIHNYQATQSESVVTLSAYPEGESFETLIKDDGRYHGSGEISFTVSIDPNNQGVRLRRRIDQGIPRQWAKVYIDGKYAGCWYYGYENEHLRWFDLDYEIPSDFTIGKNSLNVRLVVEPKDNKVSEAFSDFRYTVFCHDE